MLKPALDFAKQLRSLTRDTQQNKDAVKELRQELKDKQQELRETQRELRDTQKEFQNLSREFDSLTRVVERLGYQIQRQNDNMAHLQKELLLEMELRATRIQLGLPPVSEGDDPPQRHE